MKNYRRLIEKAFSRLMEDLRKGGHTLEPDQYPELTRPAIPPKDIWMRLTEEGRYDLIKTLRRVERREDGYGTIVTPQEGWSDDDTTHNAVLQWLLDHKVNVLNVPVEIECLTRALHS